MSNKTHSAKKRVRPPRSVDRLAQDDRGVTETSIVVNESTSNQALPDQCAPYFAALVRYIDGFYAVAMEYGIPAAKVLHHVQHAHSAVVGLQKLVAADEPKAYPHLPFDCPHADHRCSGCGLPLAEVRGALPPPGAMTEPRSEEGEVLLLVKRIGIDKTWQVSPYKIPSETAATLAVNWLKLSLPPFEYRVVTV